MEGEEVATLNEEKEDGELDSDLEEEIPETSITNQEDEIDKVLASCSTVESPKPKETREKVDSYRNEKSKDKDIPSTYRRTLKGSDGRNGSSSRRSGSKSKHESKSKKRDSISKKSKSAEVKGKSKESAKVPMIDLISPRKVSVDESMKDNYEEMEMDIETNDVCIQDGNVSFKSEQEQELRASILASIVSKKETEDDRINRERESLEKEESILEEKKDKLAKMERVLKVKKINIEDMCRRRDDYIARVQRLVKEIDKVILEEKETILKRNELEYEVDIEDNRIQLAYNELVRRQLHVLDKEYEDAEKNENKERNDIVEENINVDDVLRKDSIMDISTEESEMELRRLLLQQISNGHNGTVSTSNGDEDKEKEVEGEGGGRDGDDEHHSDNIINEEEEIEEYDKVIEGGMNKEIMELNGIEDDHRSIMCPWDLNGICKDDECPFLHDNRSGSFHQLSVMN